MSDSVALTSPSSPSSLASSPLAPLPFHVAVRDYLKAHDPEIWRWFASKPVRDDLAEQVRFDLLKSTYRVERASKPAWYAAADEAAERLGVTAPVVIYQAHNPSGINASLAFLPTEAHVVFHGPVTDLLSPIELRAVLAHELSHLFLWSGWDGEFLTAYQVLAAMTNDAHAASAHIATARHFDLYTEVFCDRGAAQAAGDPLPAIAALVKLHTGLADVDAAGYLRQADEIFSRGDAAARETTHPEAYIRARAIKLWADGDAELDAKIARAIEGPPQLDDLNLLQRERLERWTRRLLDCLLASKWFQTPSALAHARLFFSDYAPPSQPAEVDKLAVDWLGESPSLVDYVCYVLLDFAAIDRDLESAPLAHALGLAETLGCKPRLAELARKELRLRKGQLDAIDRDKTQTLAAAGRNPS